MRRKKSNFIIAPCGNRKGHRDPPKGTYRFVRLVCFGEEEEKELRIICKGNKSSPLRGRTKVGEKNKIKRGEKNGRNS